MAGKDILGIKPMEGLVKDIYDICYTVDKPDLKKLRQSLEPLMLLQQNALARQGAIYYEALGLAQANARLIDANKALMKEIRQVLREIRKLHTVAGPRLKTCRGDGKKGE